MLLSRGSTPRNDNRLWTSSALFTTGVPVIEVGLISILAAVAGSRDEVVGIIYTDSGETGF